MNKFVIFAHPRSGSTSLACVLGESKDVTMSLEPFHPKYKVWNPDERDYSKFIKDKETLNTALKEIFSKYNAIKILNYQFPENIYFELLSKNYLKVIFLTRNNLFDAAISNAVATQVGKWHKDEKANYKDLKPIDPDEIGGWIKYVGDLNKLYFDFLSENRAGDYLNVYYEDLYTKNFQKNKSELRKLCEFLEISLPSDQAINKFTMPDNAKINNENVYQNIPNYDKLREVYGNS